MSNITKNKTTMKIMEEYVDKTMANLKLIGMVAFMITYTIVCSLEPSIIDVPLV
jgi:hypothetical protein